MDVKSNSRPPSQGAGVALSDGVDSEVSGRRLSESWRCAGAERTADR